MPTAVWRIWWRCFSGVTDRDRLRRLCRDQFGFLRLKLSASKNVGEKLLQDGPAFFPIIRREAAHFPDHRRFFHCGQFFLCRLTHHRKWRRLGNTRGQAVSWKTGSIPGPLFRRRGRPKENQRNAAPLPGDFLADASPFQKAFQRCSCPPVSWPANDFKSRVDAESGVGIIYDWLASR